MTLDPQLVHRHAPGLRALVRELVLDDSRVDDVLQETWLRALHESPRSPAAFGSWIRTIARRLAFRETRSEGRRRHHEGSTPPTGDGLPRPDQIVERELARREVIDAVLKLEEPYRSAVLYRYLENRSAGEVAEHLDIPIETLRTRLKRGLAQLRGILDRQHGGEARQWHHALLPLATLPLGEWTLASTVAGGATTAAASGSMLAPLLRAALLLLACGAAGLPIWWLVAGAEPAGESTPAVIAYSAEDLEAVPELDREDLTGSSARRLFDPRAEPVTALPPASLGYRISVSGRAVDTFRRPLEGAEVTLFLRPSLEVHLEALRDGHRVSPSLRPGALTPRSCVTGRDGRFVFTGPAFRETVVSVRLRHPDHVSGTTTVPWHHLEAPVALGDLPLGNGQPLAGRVEDDAGTPCAGVRVTAWPDSSADRLRSRLAAAGSPLAATRTDLEGRFRFEHLPTSALRLVALDLPASRAATRRVDGAGFAGSLAAEPVLVLARTRTLRCSLVWSDGTPAADLPVRALPIDPRLASQLLRHDPRELFRDDSEAPRTDETGALELRLPHDRAWLLWVGTDPGRDPRHAVSILGPFRADEIPTVLEIPRGQTVQGRLQLAAELDSTAGSDRAVPEQIVLRPLRGRRGRGTLRAEVDAEGRFRFEAVAPGDWELRLPDSAQRFASEAPTRVQVAEAPLALGALSILTVPTQPLRVLDQNGRPVAGATLRWQSAESPDSPSEARRNLRTEAVRTGPEGFARLPKTTSRPPVAVALGAYEGSLDCVLPLTSAQQQVVLEDAANEIQLQRPAPASLGGRILGQATGDRALLRLRNVRTRASVARPIGGSSGANYRFDDLAPGRYEVWIEPRDNRPTARIGTVDLDAGEQRALDFEARAARPAIVRGGLATTGLPDGIGLRVRWRPDTEGPSLLGRNASTTKGIADSDQGRFELTGLPPGPGVLTIELEDRSLRGPRALTSRALTLDPDRIHTVDLQLELARLQIRSEAGSDTGPSEAQPPNRRRPRGLWILRSVANECEDVPVEAGDDLLLPAGDWILTRLDGEPSSALSLSSGSTESLLLPERALRNDSDPERTTTPRSRTRRESR